MKKITTILLLSPLFFSCKNKAETIQARAVDSVKVYMKETLDDPASYEPIEFGKLDTGETDDYLMLHDYRAKNKMGALVKGEMLFHFRKDLSIYKAR